MTLKDTRSATSLLEIGGWPYALHLAGWPEDQPVWTGSCPCQPLSSAGQRKGHADKRHLWPAFYNLIAQLSPTVVLGEQVSGKDGREWLAAVRYDLEARGYACGCLDLSAAGAGAPHIRQRLFWVADADGYGAGTRRRERQPGAPGHEPQLHKPWKASTSTGRLGDAEGNGSQGSDLSHEGGIVGFNAGKDDGLGDTKGNGRNEEREDDGRGAKGIGTEGREQRSRHGGWTDVELIPCADGKTRVTQPGLRPLADGIPDRVGRLRAYGNAIVPPLAATFVRAYMDTDIT